MPHIRPFATDDAPAVASILNESIAARDSLMILEPLEATDVRRQHDQLTDRERVLVLEEAGEVVGWGIIKRYSDRQGYRRTAETSVYLRRSHTGRGLGKTLQRALLEQSKALDYHHLVARIFADNERSIRMHRNLGYEMVGIQREIGFVDGAWKDVAIMQYVFDRS